MWYKLAAKPKDFVIAYHGTDESSWKEIQKSGYLQTNGIANLTTDKSLAFTFANDVGSGEEKVVVLTFRIPKELIAFNDEEALLTLKNNLPLSYFVKADIMKPSKQHESFQEGVHKKQVTQAPQINPQDYQKMKEEVLRNLSRNPSAYIPLYMRNDPDLVRYTK